MIRISRPLHLKTRVELVECDTVGHILDAALTAFGFSNPNVIRAIYIYAVCTVHTHIGRMRE